MKKMWFISLVCFLSFLIVLLLSVGFSIILKTHKANVKAKNDEFVIVIDCGHGGPDGGAVAADGTVEKDINLKLGHQLRELLTSYGYKVVMTRYKDEFICDDHNASLREQNISDLHNRLDIAESYPNSIFISLHMNKFSEESSWGSQLFYSPNDKNSQILAEKIRNRLIANTQKGNERALKEMDDSVYIIYNATHPALLLECGFLSNIKERERFKDNAYRSKFVGDIFEGIIDYKGEKP